jgi:hypothetical protein
MNALRLRRALSRRALINRLVLAAGGLALKPWRNARAEPPADRLDEKDPVAVAQGYVADAMRVDPKKNPQFITGQICENCLLLQGKPGDGYRPCTVFSGKLVAAAGWCKSWTAEM